MSDQSEAKRHKRGDVREDGMRFWQYRKNGSEYWVSPERFFGNLRYMQEWSEANREKRRQAVKKWAKSNPEKARAATKSWRQRNPHRAKAHRDAWDARNRDRMRVARQKYQKMRRSTDPLFALAASLRGRMNNAFKLYEWVRPSGLGTILGASLEEIKAHLESLFQPGMSWENRSEWHIDHIIPFATAKTQEELVALCHYTNLQPLWAKDNLRKGAKLPNDSKEHQL